MRELHINEMKKQLGDSDVHEEISDNTESVISTYIERKKKIGKEEN